MTTTEKVLLRIVTILAPMPTGYIVCTALIQRAWYPVFAVAAAIALEGLGYFAALLIMAVSEHNRTLYAAERKAFGVQSFRAWFPAIAYTSIVLLFTTLLEIVPGAYVWSLAAFPLLGLLSAWTFSEFRLVASLGQGVAAQRLANQQTKEKQRQEKRLAKLANQQAKEKQPSQPAPPTATTKGHNKIDRAALVAALTNNPSRTNAELGKLFNVSAEAIRKRRETITPAEIGLTNP